MIEASETPLQPGTPTCTAHTTRNLLVIFKIEIIETVLNYLFHALWQYISNPCGILEFWCALDTQFGQAQEQVV